MIKNTYGFKDQLFGLNKMQVDEYLRNLQETQNNELDKYKDGIEELENKKKNLKKEIEDLKQEIAFELKDMEFMKYAIRKSNEYANIIEKISKEKAIEIEAFRKKEEEIINKEIKNYNDIIKSSKEELNNLLEMEVKKGKDIIKEISGFINEKSKSVDGIKDTKDDLGLYKEEFKSSEDSICSNKDNSFWNDEDNSELIASAEDIFKDEKTVDDTQ